MLTGDGKPRSLSDANDSNTHSWVRVLRESRLAGRSSHRVVTGEHPVSGEQIVGDDTKELTKVRVYDGKQEGIDSLDRVVQFNLPKIW